MRGGAQARGLMAPTRAAEAPMEEPLLANTLPIDGDGLDSADVRNGDRAASFRWGTPNPDRQQVG